MQNYAHKLCEDLLHNNGQYIYDKKELLHQVKLYYINLFKNQDNNLNTETSESLRKIKVPQVTGDNLGDHIQLIDMNSALKK